MYLFRTKRKDKRTKPKKIRHTQLITYNPSSQLFHHSEKNGLVFSLEEFERAKAEQAEVRRSLKKIAWIPNARKDHAGNLRELMMWRYEGFLRVCDEVKSTGKPRLFFNRDDYETYFPMVTFTEGRLKPHYQGLFNRLTIHFSTSYLQSEQVWTWSKDGQIARCHPKDFYYDTIPADATSSCALCNLCELTDTGEAIPLDMCGPEQHREMEERLAKIVW